jgi:hypothetical protein
VKSFGEQLSIRYFPNAPLRVGEEGSQFLFTRDLPLGIVPGRINPPTGFAVHLEPDDEAARDALTALFDVGRYTRHDLAEATHDFVETVARLLGYQGEAHFELVGGGDPERPLRLVALPPGTVRRSLGTFHQLIPKAERAEHDGRRGVRIPSEKLWRVRLPRALGGPRRHRRMLRALGARSSPMPDFLLKSDDMGASAGYDFASHRRACEVAIERATRRWGTIPSRFQVDGTTEYFLFSRRLAFKRSQAEIRDHVIAELNGLLDRLEIPQRVVISGLRSAAEIERTLKQLGAGEISVSEAMDVDRD